MSNFSDIEEDVVKVNVSKWLDMTKTIKSYQRKFRN